MPPNDFAAQAARGAQAIAKPCKPWRTSGHFLQCFASLIEAELHPLVEQVDRFRFRTAHCVSK